MSRDNLIVVKSI